MWRPWERSDSEDDMFDGNQQSQQFVPSPENDPNQISPERFNDLSASQSQNQDGINVVKEEKTTPIKDNSRSPILIDSDSDDDINTIAETQIPLPDSPLIVPTNSPQISLDTSSTSLPSKFKMK